MDYIARVGRTFAFFVVFLLATINSLLLSWGPGSADPVPASRLGMEHPPSVPNAVLARMEAVVASAEAVIHNPSLTEDEASRQALHLEDSELNRLEDAWLHGFRVTTSLLLRALAPDMPSHIRRLVDAVYSSSTDPTLQAQADALWATYHKQQETASRTQTSG